MTLSPTTPPPEKAITITAARTHNLQNVSLAIPRDQFVVITGVSGSGKSSLAFDTIYAEGQRKFVESLSAYARQFLGQMLKPDVEQISGLPPTIAIAQTAARSSPRSTVGTTTEIYDYLRLLFARVGTVHCPNCGGPVVQHTLTQIVDAVVNLPAESKAMILAPLVRERVGIHEETFARVLRDGFVRVRVDGEIHEIKSVPTLDEKQPHSIEAIVDRVVAKGDIRARVTDSVETALRITDGLTAVVYQSPGDETWHEEQFSRRYACIRCGVQLPELEPRLFSFNSPHGACPTCDGLGNVLEFDAELVVPDPKVSLENGAIAPWRRSGPKSAAIQNKLLRDFCEAFKISPATPFSSIPKKKREILLRGTTLKDEKEFATHFEGVIPNLRRRWETTKSDHLKDRLHPFMSVSACAACKGARLRPESLAVRIGGQNIDEVTHQSIDAAVGFFTALKFQGQSAQIADPLLREIRQRLQFLIDVGIGYLSLARPTSTLSSGEAQRIRLATQIGSGLVGVCYVLDEPTTGLHPRDTSRLIRTLRELCTLGNSLIVVEHDVEMIEAAQWIVDVGPGPGAHGGKILVNGPPADLWSSRDSITAQYLRHEQAIPLREQHRPTNPKRIIEIRGAAENNLKNINVRLPLGVFCCITGVSGSGKSTLVNQILLPAVRRHLTHSHKTIGRHDSIDGLAAIERIIDIDQSPVGKSPRSVPATYCGIFDDIRELFAKTREAKLRGYDAARFSFNARGGRCEACRGYGTRRIEMHFLPDMFVQCDHCKGTRYSPETLDIKFRGQSIADVLNLRVEEALEHFESFSAIKARLAALVDVGLGYLSLGQPAATLSGGESQRLKLAAQLVASTAGHTLYILDEPTSGLHFADIHRLLEVLNRLCDIGHSLIVIEHNLDVIRQADWIIDLGPEGGEAGGFIVAEGTPEQIAACKKSHTGRYLSKSPEPI